MGQPNCLLFITQQHGSSTHPSGSLQFFLQISACWINKSKAKPSCLCGLNKIFPPSYAISTMKSNTFSGKTSFILRIRRTFLFAAVVGLFLWQSFFHTEFSATASDGAPHPVIVLSRQKLRKPSNFPAADQEKAPPEYRPGKTGFSGYKTACCPTILVPQLQHHNRGYSRRFHNTGHFRGRPK